MNVLIPLLIGCVPPSPTTPPLTPVSDTTDTGRTSTPGLRECDEPRPVDMTWDGPSTLALPDVSVLCDEPAAREPGCLLIETTSDAGQGVMVLDPQLRLVWTWAGGGGISDVTPDGDGALRLLYDSDIATLTPDGAVTPLTDEPNRLHHEVHETAAGTLLTLSNHSLDVDDHPLAYGSDPPRGPATLSDHDIVEIDADTGAVLNRVRLSDVLPTDRVVRDSLGEAPSGLDWSHPNSVVDRDGGGWLVNVRNQQALIALQPEGTLDWILADPGGWPPELQPLLLEPVGDLRWHYESHAAEWHAGGLVVMFDNHYTGHLPFDPPPEEPVFSRVVAYQVDEVAGTVEQLWEHEQTTTGPLYARAFGDADLLPETGNVLAVWGWVSEENGVPYTDSGLGVHAARVVQLAPDGRVVLDLRLTTDDPSLPNGFKVYRAESVPCLEGWQPRAAR